ncbi:DUF1116 domain-containing protein [Jiella sp. MQZ9-1]|uniref:DUF1116 domain-containing protein n=1 Tax=Jiella flava TaxID=2816857 RepID=A0A939FX81_9HYPH|nr:DUF1116 domain-containing protein [Jiella flava]MBO0662544.1 DUF1116 domain-containing protein [Jiella flava]MCD2472915.1 DUF1116 domain-containing protein [Jiella flava]
MTEDSINPANDVALRRIHDAEPVLTAVVRASDALGLGDRELGHAGPPFKSPAAIPWLVLSALSGAVVHEGWADDTERAREMILAGAIRLRANHDLGTVSPMAGVVRPSQMVMRVENRNGSGVTYATLAEAGRQAMRFGVYNAQVAAGLRWLDDTLAPALAAALPVDGLPVLPLIADGVALGDDVHQRNIGGMMALIRALPSLQNEYRSWLFANPQHFLNYAMAAVKLALDQAEGVAGSSLVTAITRNGVECGIRVAGTGRRWFTAPASIPAGGWFEPFGAEDAQADLGDSAIVEAYGLGGAIAHASPEIARAMERSWSEATQAGQAMRGLYIAANPVIAPALCGAAGVGLGLDAARVVQEGLPIRIHTGIGHKDGQSGWIGVGVAEAPVACFSEAVRALGEMR